MLINFAHLWFIVVLRCFLTDCRYSLEHELHRCKISPLWFGSLRAWYATFVKLLNSSTVILYFDAIDWNKEFSKWYFAKTSSCSLYSSSANNQEQTEINTKKTRSRRSAALRNRSILQTLHLHRWRLLHGSFEMLAKILCSRSQSLFCYVYN